MAERTKSTSTGNARSDAQTALFDAITDGVNDLYANTSEYTIAGQASVLRSLALAYRLTAGGPQPGSTTAAEK